MMLLSILTYISLISSAVLLFAYLESLHRLEKEITNIKLYLQKRTDIL